jgi:hypothetical protein
MVCELGTDKDVEVLVVYSRVGLLSLHVSGGNEKETKSVPVRIVDLWTEIGVRYLKCNPFVPFVVRTLVQRICSLLHMYAFGNVETVLFNYKLCHFYCIFRKIQTEKIK